MDLLNSILGLGAVRRYFGGDSGYVGYSKSKRAVAAEERGLRSKSQMNKDFANEVNTIIIENGGTPVTLKTIKDALSHIVADEWHHTSMYGNKTDYYSAATIAKFFNSTTKEFPSGSSSNDFEKVFDDIVMANTPITFEPTEYSNGVSIAVFTAHNGIKLPYKYGYSLYVIYDNDTLPVKSAKAEYNNNKKFHFIHWKDNVFVPSLIKKDFDNRNFFDYKLR